jgi:hypothetical protein
LRFDRFIAPSPAGHFHIELANAFPAGGAYIAGRRHRMAYELMARRVHHRPQEYATLTPLLFEAT